MPVILSPDAQVEFAQLDHSLKPIFAKHLAKFEQLPPRRFLRRGLPYCVENVGPGRIVCRNDGGIVSILHIFQTHKQYEHWYRQTTR